MYPWALLRFAPFTWLFIPLAGVRLQRSENYAEAVAIEWSTVCWRREAAAVCQSNLLWGFIFQSKYRERWHPHDSDQRTVQNVTVVQTQKCGFFFFFIFLYSCLYVTIKHSLSIFQSATVNRWSHLPNCMQAFFALSLWENSPHESGCTSTNTDWKHDPPPGKREPRSLTLRVVNTRSLLISTGLTASSQLTLIQTVEINK